MPFNPAHWNLSYLETVPPPTLCSYHRHPRSFPKTDLHASTARSVHYPQSLSAKSIRAPILLRGILSLSTLSSDCQPSLKTWPEEEEEGRGREGAKKAQTESSYHCLGPQPSLRKIFQGIYQMSQKPKYILMVPETNI